MSEGGFHVAARAKRCAYRRTPRPLCLPRSSRRRCARSFVASREDEACADKRTVSRARQHGTLLRTFGGTTGTIGAHRCAPTVALRLSSPAFHGVSFVT